LSEKNKLVNQAIFVFVRKASLLALIIIATATHVMAHDSEPRDFIIMKTPYRHLIVSPMPTTPDGVLDVEKIIVEASMVTLPDLTPESNWHLTRMIDAIKAEDDYAVEQHWSDFIGSIKNNRIPLDINSVLLWTLRQSYLEANKDLSFFASKVKFFNDLKKTLRDELDEAERLWGEKGCQATPVGTVCSLDEVCCNMEVFISALQGQLQAVEDDTQLANLKLQSALQEHTQLVQAISSIMKAWNEALKDIIENLK
jgi:hypothetical protein